MPTKAAPGIRISADLTLPLDLVVEATAVVGKRGRGKTVTCKRIVEEAHRNHVTFVVVDPTDVWWGLQSGADGSEGGGLDGVLIVGGKHGNVPLAEHAGKMLARMTLDGTSMVVVTKGLPKAARRRLVGEMLTELYDLADGSIPVLVVIDEADEYAPQSTGGFGGNKQNDPLVLCQGAVDDIVRRGRAGGLGTLLITQRVAVLSKNALEQSDTLIAHGVTGKNDIDAVASWIAKHATDEAMSKQITSSLPSLPKGTAWVWSPEYDVLKCVEVQMISTWDSSRSPRPHEVVATPKGRKTIDLAALGEEMARFAAEVEADDPKALRRRIAELERKLAERPPVQTEPVEVPVLDPATRKAAEAAIAKFTAAAESLRGLHESASDQARTILDGLMRAGGGGGNGVPRARQAGDGARPVADRSAPRVPAERADRTAGRQPSSAPVPRAAAAAPTGELGGPQQKVVDAIAWLHDVGFETPTKIQAGFMAGYRVGKAGGGRFGNILGELRTAGYLDYPRAGCVALTPAGIAVAATVDFPRTTEGLQAAVKARLAEPEARVLDVIIAAYPNALTKQEAGAQAGYTVGPAGGGRFGNILGRLRSLGLIDYPDAGMVAAEPILFLDR